MLPRMNRIGAIALIGIVVGSVFLLEILGDRSAAGYVIPLATTLCIVTAWLLVRTSSKSTSKIDVDDVDEQHKGLKPLTKGFLAFLGAIGWTGVVTAAVRHGVIPSNATIILWSLAPAFVLLVVAAVYLLRGFSSDAQKKPGSPRE